MRYKDSWETDIVIAFHGSDTKYNILSFWGCEKSIMKKGII